MKTTGFMNGKNIKKIALAAVVVLLSVAPLKAQVEWTTIDEMGSIDLKENNKLGFIDFYTTWCGRCKKLDSDTFTNDTVARILNKYYMAAKVDAETKDDITWKGIVYKNPDLTRKTTHSFVKHIIIGKISYPTTVVLDKHMNVINVLPGYFSPKDFVKVLWYFVNDNYKKYPFENYNDVFESQIRPKMNKDLGYK